MNLLKINPYNFRLDNSNLVLVITTLFLLGKPSISTAQLYQFVGVGSNNGSIYAVNEDGTDPQKWKNFATGINPDQSELVDSNGKLWGMTYDGGIYNEGVIYHIDYDGSNYTEVHQFEENRGNPRGSLTEYNGKLWGMSEGEIFSLDTDGTNYTIHHSFDATNSPLQGYSPIGSLLISNSKFWGITTMGGAAGSEGVIFTLNLDGSGYEKVHDFVSSSGTTPFGELAESNGKIWGTTISGPNANHYGVIFSIDTDGTNYTKVYEFNDTDGSDPFGGLIAYNSKLWGMTTDGGSNGLGVIYSIDDDGTNYTKIYDFDNTSGAGTWGTLVLSNGKFWGLNEYGGANSLGTIFTVDTDGNNFTVVHDFISLSDGANPKKSLIEADGKLYGTTGAGFSSLNDGVIFSIDTDGNNYSVIHDFHRTTGENPVKGLVLANNKLWGVTSAGGTDSYGTIVSIDTDGSNFTTVHSFDNTKGGLPVSKLTESNGVLWGTTRLGGSNSYGTIYTMSTDGLTFTKVHDFDDTNGSNPLGGLTEINGKLWGMTQWGGTNNIGIIYSINTDGTSFTKVHDFNSTNGALPYGKLTESNNKIWGMTTAGGANSFGVLFNMDTDGTNFSVVHDFGSATGYQPYGSLTEINGKLWGTTRVGGTNNAGVIFTIDTDGTNYEVVHHFDNTSGGEGFPEGDLMEVNGKVWGVTPAGGLDYIGVLFKLDLDGTNYTKVFDFEQNSTGGIGSTTGLLFAQQIKDGQFIDFSSVGSKTYGDNSFTLTASSNSANPISFSSSDVNIISINGDMASINGAGTVTLTAYQEADNSYTAGSTEQVVDLAKASLEAMANDHSKVYGEVNPEFTVSYTGFVGSDNSSDIDTEPVGGSNATEQSPVDTYDITLTGGTDNNYDIEISSSPGVLTITPASLTITADDKAITEGETIPTLTMSFDSFVNDDTEADITLPSISTDATSSSPTGVYDIILSGGSADNYDLTLINGILTIEAALGLNNEAEPLNVYPNPTQGYFSISNKIPPSILLVTSLDGKVVKSFSPNKENRYSIADLSVGTYIVMAKSYKGWDIARIRKEH